MSDKETLLKALNDDLAHEFQAVIMYTNYAAMLTGPWRGELANFMQAEIPDEQMHAQFLAGKIAAMGGAPVSTPAEVPMTDNPKEMLENIRDAEADAVRRYTERAEQAAEYGDRALQVRLEDMVADEQGHLEETKMLLRNWPV